MSMIKFVQALREIGIDVEGHSVWYRALSPDGSLWCESSSPSEVRQSIRGREGYTLEQFTRYLITTPWEPWNPS